MTSSEFKIKLSLALFHVLIQKMIAVVRVPVILIFEEAEGGGSHEPRSS